MFCEIPPEDGPLEDRVLAFLNDRSAGAVTGPRRMGRDEFVEYVARVARSAGMTVSLLPDSPTPSPDVTIHRHWSGMDEGPADSDVLYGQDLCHQVPSVVRLRREGFRESHLSGPDNWNTMAGDPVRERFNPWRDRAAFGALGVVLGVLALVLDDDGMQAVVACFGAFAVVVGLVQAFCGHRAGFPWSEWTGALLVVAGAVVLVLAFAVENGHRVVLGAGLVVSGLVALAGMGRGYALAKMSRLLSLVVGLALLVFGLCLAFWPDLDDGAAMLAAGVFMVVAGLLALYGAYNLRRVERPARF